MLIRRWERTSFERVLAPMLAEFIDSSHHLNYIFYYIRSGPILPSRSCPQLLYLRFLSGCLSAR